MLRKPRFTHTNSDTPVFPEERRGEERRGEVLTYTMLYLAETEIRACAAVLPTQTSSGMQGRGRGRPVFTPGAISARW